MITVLTLQDWIGIVVLGFFFIFVLIPFLWRHRKKNPKDDSTTHAIIASDDDD